MPPAEIVPLRVRVLEEADRPRWDAFVRRHGGGSFFHLAGWREVIEGVFRHPACFLFAERDGEILGVLPLARVKSLFFGHSMSSLPFCVYGGVVAADPEVAAALESEAERRAREAGVDYLEYRNLAACHEDWPRQDLYVTFRKAILPEAEANLLSIPRKQRAMVRKGIQAGLVSRIDEDVDRFFPLYAGNMHRHGTPPLPRRYFRRLKEVFGEACEVMLIEDQGGVPVSGVISFYFGDMVLPYYAGDLPAARELAANDFKYWELMRRACERGCRLFDFGRSKRGTGSFAFKKNWGFMPEPLSYEYRLYGGRGVPQNNPANPRYRLFIAAWRRLPIGLANWLGPMIVRNLG